MIDRETVIALADQAGFVMVGNLQGAGRLPELLERFAQLVDQKAVEAEREACAAMLDARAASYLSHGNKRSAAGSFAAASRMSEGAAAIRARSTGGGV